MSEVTIEELAIGERNFLHDLANHILVAQGMSSFVLKSIKENPNVMLKEVERLEKVCTAVAHMAELLKDRRILLRNLSKEESS